MGLTAITATEIYAPKQPKIPKPKSKTDTLQELDREINIEIQDRDTGTEYSNLTAYSYE